MFAYMTYYYIEYTNFLKRQTYLTYCILFTHDEEIDPQYNDVHKYKDSSFQFDFLILCQSLCHV